MNFRSVLAFFLLCCWISCSGALAVEHDTDCVAWWRFDDKGSDEPVDVVSGAEDDIKGNFEYAEGVRGYALNFDGYTTFVVRDAEDAPRLTDGFTIEAWVAPQVYPWSWTAIVDQQGPAIKQEKEKLPAEVSDEQLKPGLFGIRFKGADLTRPEEEPIILKKPDNDWSGGENNWSARWHGYIEGPYTGNVAFTARADNGMKLVVNGKTVIDIWDRDNPRTGEIQMIKGKKYPVELTYFQDGGKSTLSLNWVWSNRGSRGVYPLWHTEEQQRLLKKQLGVTAEPAERKTHIFFGLDAAGHPAMKLNLSGRLYECVSDKQLPLLKWSHVAGTFDSEKGITLFINGKEAGSLSTKGTLQTEGLSDLWIGRSHRDMAPARTERAPSRRIHSPMIFDGLIDEVKIYRRALSGQDVVRYFHSPRPKNPKPLQYRRMPSGPTDLPKRFCAFYTRLRYDDKWERLWRVDRYPDILVTFDTTNVRVVFWRGTNYGASWITPDGKWMGDQSLEDGTEWGCGEHMSDKQCRYSRVRLIENTDARILVHWRYAVCDILYNINHEDPVTGWGDWADEYYYIYPDGVATRKQVLHSSEPDGFQWQETIFFNQPGTGPEDNVQMQAFTLANMNGQTHTYSWKDGAPDDFGHPAGANIQMTNLKSKYRPFIIFPSGREITAFGGDGEFSNFPCWNHWPVSLVPNDGREVFAGDRPSSSSLSNRKPDAEHTGGVSYAAVSLYGMTEKTIEELLPLAKSWNYPAKLNLLSDGFTSQGYDKYQRAYVLQCEKQGEPSKLKFKLAASEQSTVVNPAFVIRNWGTSGAKLMLDGKSICTGSIFRLGHRRRLEGTDLIIWIEKRSSKPVKITLSRTEN